MSADLNDAMSADLQHDPRHLTQLKAAVATLRTGGVLAYPTEAVWGLGCDPWQSAAFERLLHLKQRPPEKGVILLADCIDRVRDLLSPLTIAQRQSVMQSWLMAEPDQPATTWLLPPSSAVPPWIMGHHPRVAVRVTRHPLCQALCQAFDGMIVSTSANPAGANPALTELQVRAYFADQVDVLPGELGQHPRPSRIIDAVTGHVIRA